MNNNIVYVRLQGESHDISFSDLDIGDLSSDEDIKQAIINYFGISNATLVDCVIEHHTSGNITVRPKAVFG